MDWLWQGTVAFFLLTGSFLMVVAALGIWRFPDIYCRLHASGKSETLGIVLLIIGVIIAFPGDLGVLFRGILAILFQFLTVPVATHLLARACYLTDIRPYEGTAMDELREHMPPDPERVDARRQEGET